MAARKKTSRRRNAETLAEWAARQPLRVGDHSSGAKWIPDALELVDRSGAWHLSDWRVSGVRGGTIWFVRRNPRARRELSVPEQHQRRIAQSTMRLHCAGARIMGGMDHPTAAALLGKPLPPGCTCRRPNTSADAWSYARTLRGKARAYAEKLAAWGGGELPPIPRGLTAERAAAIRSGVFSLALKDVRNPGNPAGVLSWLGTGRYVLRFAGREIPGTSRKALEGFAKRQGVSPLEFRDERGSPSLHQGPEFNPGWAELYPSSCERCAAIAEKEYRKTGNIVNISPAEPGTRRCKRHRLRRKANPRSSPAAMFEKWHGFPPDHVTELPIPPIDGQRLVFLGTLRRIDYDSPKWSKASPGKRKQVGYWHESTGRPYLLTNAAGNVVVLFDPTGRFRVTPDGLVK